MTGTKRKSTEIDTVQTTDGNASVSSNEEQQLYSQPSSASPSSAMKKQRKKKTTGAGSGSSRPRTLTGDEIKQLLDDGKFFDILGDDNVNLAIYDDCNEIRNKINKFLRSNRMTQTEFLKYLRVNSNSYRRFMGMRVSLHN